MKTSGPKTAFQGRAKQIMIRIADNGALRTTALMQMLGLGSTQAISGYLKPLREEGFVVSEKGGGGDKRFVYHDLTRQGREFLDGLRDGQINAAPEMKLWTSEEIEREFGKPEKEVENVSYYEHQEQENAGLTRKEELQRIADELRRKNAANEEKEEFGIKENDDGSLSF
jgi:DNA-binding PadR family transcriptional regulator